MRFRAFQDIVATGQDPEAADIDNPQGYILATRWFVDAVGDDGAVYIHDSEYKSEAEATFMAQRFAASDRGVDVTTSAAWRFNRFAYGSIGYEVHGGEEALIQQERYAHH